MDSIAAKRLILPISVLVTFMIFVLDIQTKKGTADYIFYFIPVALCIFHSSPKIPILSAIICTIVSLLGFYFSPDNNKVDTGLALQNRFSAIFCFWVVSLLVRRVIIIKNETEEKSWLRSGLNQFATRVRGEKNSEEIASEAMTFMSDYIGTSLACVYLKKENDNSLEFIKGHAYQQEGSYPSNIKLGEGLIGQAALDNQIITLEQVPTDYVKVSSALGQSSPSFLQVLPLVADNQLIGVLEVAFLKVPRMVDQELLKDLSSALGVTFRSALYKEKLAELLAMSQQFAEELQSQQEELRVSNEELEQQSKALKESAMKLECQQVELEQSNQNLEEQAQMLENQKSILDEKNRQLQRSQDIMEEKTKELEQSGKYKSEFLANMSHELRTPLNSSLILARLLADNKQGNLNEDQIKYAEIIYTSGNDLLTLINDVLDLSKVEAGKLEVRPERIKITHLIESLKKSILPQALEKGITFETKIHDDTPEEIITDRVRLEQVLKNFLSNALKFTEKGSVNLETRASGNSIVFDVKDTGIGIEEKKLDIIFEAFQQADGTTNRKYGGTGLGLSISKELTNLLGGSIEVKSSLNQGSTFTLLLPKVFNVPATENIRTIHRNELPQEKKVAQEVRSLNFSEKGTFNFTDDRSTITEYSRKMLIIEDDEVFAKILYDLAHEMNFGVVTVGTANEGIQLASIIRPEAIILDIRLPDHNGLMVLDQLKANPLTRHIPVHIISGQDFTKSALEMGAVGYMMKPVKRDEIKNTLQTITMKLNKNSKSILLVEDDEVQRNYIIDLISDTSIKVEAVDSGKEALEKLSNQTYDCMIMDLNLPDMTGNELLSKIALNAYYSFPPVIVYTAREVTQDEEEKLLHHAGSIIIKGAKSPERLLSEVTLFLHRVESELPMERQKMLKELRNRDKTLENSKILVVDDDVRNIFALTSVLETMGARVEVARNGKEALQKMQEHDDIDIVLMDIMMPEMDGYEATRKIRENNKWNDIPVIALTAKAMKTDHDKCLAAGANDYMAKPVQTDKLLSLIRIWLPTKRRFLL